MGTTAHRAEALLVAPGIIVATLAFLLHLALTPGCMPQGISGPSPKAWPKPRADPSAPR
jgi:hypothetical protein